MPCKVTFALDDVKKQDLVRLLRVARKKEAKAPATEKRHNIFEWGEEAQQKLLECLLTARTNKTGKKIDTRLAGEFKRFYPSCNIPPTVLCTKGSNKRHFKMYAMIEEKSKPTEIEESSRIEEALRWFGKNNELYQRFAPTTKQCTFSLPFERTPAPEHHGLRRHRHKAKGTTFDDILEDEPAALLIPYSDVEARGLQRVHDIKLVSEVRFPRRKEGASFHPRWIPSTRSVSTPYCENQPLWKRQLSPKSNRVPEALSADLITLVLRSESVITLAVLNNKLSEGLLQSTEIAQNVFLPNALISVDNRFGKCTVVNTNDYEHNYIRHKCGLLNGIRDGLKFLFGVPDADDAKFYSDSINQLINDRKQMSTLVQQQVRIISSAISNFNHSAVELDKNTATMNDNLRKLCQHNLTYENKDQCKIEGYHFVEMDYFLKKALSLQSLNNLKCTGDKLEYFSEKRNGLVNVHTLKCNMCDCEEHLTTEKPQTSEEKSNNHSTINTAAVWVTLPTGGSYTQLTELLSAMNAPALGGTVLWRSNNTRYDPSHIQTTNRGGRITTGYWGCMCCHGPQELVQVSP
ncbi:hypothetical protein ILUMI_10938 [Ignelater luminosus]|uniref:Mutator-like transposase domain-containing protein n=1 Tax=Ignelater luminosus TaxID=2038154 RepID=A0A8K0D2C0_IGNLU|nr:hypothetical protein ILUMI_10938 [Ignelater luminosus]